VKEQWNNDRVQFARLLCELTACMNPSLSEWKDLCESMDLTLSEVEDLFQRAEKVWEDAKNANTQNL
jgi:hypothetical protein